MQPDTIATATLISLFWHVLVHANRLQQFCLFGGHNFWRIWFSARTFQGNLCLFLTLNLFSPLQIYPAMDMDSANSVVLQALTQATSQDTAVLKPAEEQLRQWETQPGFYSVLLVRNDVQYLTTRCLKPFFKCAICNIVDAFTLSKMVINCLIDMRFYEAVLQASFVIDITCPAASHIPVNIRFLLRILDEYHILTDVKNMGDHRQKHSILTVCPSSTHNWRPHICRLW